MKSRQPGIDLLRCLGLLFVNGVHAYLYNGYYYEEQVGFFIWGANSFKWLFFTCNGLFMLLTGYLKCEKSLNKQYYRSLLPILVGYLLTCLVTFPVRHFLLGEELSLYEWLEKMVTFGNYAWYIEMYIGLLLFSPIINLALNQLKTPKQLYWIAGTMVVITALPSITPVNLVPDYWTSLYPVTYYVIGAVIRKLQPQPKRWVPLSLAAAFAMWLGLLTLITADEFSQGYGGFWTMLTTTCIFLALYRVKVSEKAAKILAWASGGVFEGYLLSKAFDIWTYPLVKQWHKPEHYLLVFLCVTLPTFFVVLLLGKAVHVLSGKIANAIPGFREKTIPAQKR